MLNSRTKDFYDIWLLSLKFGFDGEALAKAIRLTLENRGTELPQAVTAFIEEFVEKKAGIGRRSTSVWCNPRQFFLVGSGKYSFTARFASCHSLLCR